MSDGGYVIGGWLATAAVLAGYTVHLLRRVRAVGRALPPEERTWQ